jgi:hypothetical protein
VLSRRPGYRPISCSRPLPERSVNPFAVALLALVGSWLPVMASGAQAGASDACLADPSAQIAALPSGGIWDGHGSCYEVPDGIQITQSLTLTDATFRDDSTSPPSRGSFSVVQVKAASRVHLTNLTIIGGEDGNQFHGPLVGQAGIRLLNTQLVDISHVTIGGVFGDGLELWGSFPSNPTPNRNVHVEDLDVRSAGRDGISPSNVTDSTFDDITIGPTGQASIDFESDLKGIGAGNLTFSNCRWSGFIVGEALTGPIDVVDSQLTNQILVRFRHPQAYSITFRRDAIAFTPKAIPGISVNRGSLVFVNTTFSREPGAGPPKGPMWLAINGSYLQFRNSPVVSPLGRKDATSTVVLIDRRGVHDQYPATFTGPPVATPEAPGPLLLGVPVLLFGFAAVIRRRRSSR